MKSRNSHTGKSPADKDYYARAIKRMGAEPTVDETVPFSQTDDTRQDFSVPTSRNRRPEPVFHQISEHFRENWPRWILAVAGIVLMYLMGDSRATVASIDTKVQYIQEDIKDLKQSNRENLQKIQNQELQVQKNEMRIDNLEKKKKQ
jgi:hypothetical protein